MSSQDRNYSHFRLFRMLVLLILFTSPTISKTNGLSLPQSFLKLESALMTSQSDNEFNKLIIECLASVEWQQLSDFAIQEFQGLIKKIPPEIANSEKGRLFTVSVHLICLINQLYKQAVILAEDYKQHRDMFKELQTKMKVVLQTIKTQINSLPKIIDFATLYERMAKVMEILNDFHIELEKVTNDVKNGIINSRSGIPLATGCGVAAVVVCGASTFDASPWVKGLTCVPSIGGIAYSIMSFFSLDKTSEELNQLQKETKKLRLEFAKHRAQLQVQLALMKAKLNHSRPVH